MKSAFKATRSIAGKDFNNCGKVNIYCHNCSESMRKDCQWEMDRILYPDFHKRAVDNYIKELTS